jgi:hypothetical protein
MLNELINIEELTRERTPSELLSWFDQKNDQIYWSSAVGRKALILHAGLAKKFMEEIYPLAIWGKRKFGDTDQVLIRPVIGGQNYDAIVTDLRTKPASQSYVEITQSHEGENEYLRSVVVQNEGAVGRYDTVIKKGTKKTGLKVSAEPGGADPIQAAKDDLERILAAAKGKEGKGYPANTSLIIFFYDRLHFFEGRRYNTRFTRVIDDANLDDFVNRNILDLDLRFSTLYLVGEHHVFREYSLIKKI